MSTRAPVALLVILALFAALAAAARPDSAGAEGGGALVAEPVLGAAAAGVRQLFGPSPGEAPGEVWGVGEASKQGLDFVRYTDAGGWEAVADPLDGEGKPVSFARQGIPQTAAAGRTTIAGGVVVAASLGSTSEAQPKVLVVRDPGGRFRVVTAPTLPTGEQLFRASAVQLMAADESGGDTGAFVVPTVKSGAPISVLHYDGEDWSEEPVCVAPPGCTQKSGFSTIAVDGTGPGNAWLLAKQATLAEKAGALVLLRREGGEWRQQLLGGELGAALVKELSTPAPGVKVRVTPREKGQPLTVTSQGVWIDAFVCVGSSEANANVCKGGERYDATFYYDIASGTVTGSWCDVPGAAAVVCTHPLGAALSSGEGRSFAWPAKSGEEFGTRAITGIGQGAMLIFEGGAFSRIPLSGNGGGQAGAALSAPDQGWLGPSYRLTRAPVPSGLAPWPVPFRRPLTAVAPQPGAPVAALSSEAIAVGDGGEVVRYLPGQGWQPESLLSGSGARATPALRAVAWPEPDLAYAVGDEGAMWLWRATTRLWEPDPGAPPNLIRGNFTGIAFDSGKPSWGYAVGKQGLLLRYGKRWTQDRLPPGLDPEINITSIAFAGEEALATYTLAVGKPGEPAGYVGGLLVEDGSGWRVEEQASQALEAAEAGIGTVAPRRIAGLADGGAVIAGATGGVIEREAAGAPWHAVLGPPLGFPAALAAIREGGQVKAILAVESNPIGGSTAFAERGTDEPQALAPPPSGQAPLLTHPYPLPKNAYVVRQTATGWRDEQRQSYAAPSPFGQPPFRVDLPRIPDPALALLISPDGNHGWAVGGQTGEIAPSQFGPYLREGLQTGSVMRYGLDAAPPENASTAPIAVPAGEASFAIGGNAACEGPCADLGGTGIGPDVWLRAAVGKAAALQAQGVRGFLYTGSSVAPSAATLGRLAFGEEEDAYARRLGSAAGSLPVYAAPAATDLNGGSLAAFGSAFEGFPAPLGSAPVGPGITAVASGDRSKGNYSYAFDSDGAAGLVRVIVLDLSISPLSPEKQCWLAQQLAGSAAADPPRPAIVVGNREAGGDAALRQLLVTGSSAACTIPGAAGASAYVFETSANRRATLSWGSASIPTFGTGTLGYTKIPETTRNEYVPASGFLLLSVDVAARNQANVAPVEARLIPSIGSLALDATDGTLLRRSQTALFQALARRPLAGISCAGNEAPSRCDGVSPDSYVEIPARCVSRTASGAGCAAEIFPVYEFTSSNPDIADFVKVDPASTNPKAVFLSKAGKPVPDPSSGLLCAFNAGSTTVTVKTGGLSYSERVTVQRGSVQRPCGTVPLRNPPTQPAVAPPPLPEFPEPASLPGNPPLGLAPPPPPTAHVPAAKPHPHPHPHPTPTLPAPFLPPSPGLTPVVAIVPPPPPPAAQTTPPSGTSPVTQPVPSPAPEEEDEVAVDVVHHMSALPHPAPGFHPALPGPDRGTSWAGLALPGLALLAALGATLLLAPLRRREPDLARQSNTALRRAYR